MSISSEIGLLASAFIPPVARDIRCACDHCGAHTVAAQGWRMQGHCANCGSFELTPVDGATPSPPA